MLSSDCDRECGRGEIVGVIMGNATLRSFGDLGAIFSHATNSPKEETEAASQKNNGKATNYEPKPAAPVVLYGDDARQGVTGHNVRYVLGFGLFGAAAGLALVALIVGRGSAVM